MKLVNIDGRWYREVPMAGQGPIYHGPYETSWGATLGGIPEWVWGSILLVFVLGVGAWVSL